ncbi:MAG: carbonic anhydrase [Bacteroidetes bacterium]|nr:carbonic anhydrase [Bacteroidota bacterium]MCB9074682.1 carbonic anhydrase [Chitinophagales bacterium]
MYNLIKSNCTFVKFILKQFNPTYNLKTLDKNEKEHLTPEMALQILKNGNERFVNNLEADRNLLEQVNATRDGQSPFAIILSCIDSRTSAELIFDQGLGDIFSVRIAGNVINTDVIGSMEYACKLANSKLIVVLGHTKCGAIKGACDFVELGSLTELLTKIQPAVYAEKTTPTELRNSKNLQFVNNVSAINVKKSVQAILDRSYILEQMVASGAIGIVGGMYDIETGKVDFYEDIHH